MQSSRRSALLRTASIFAAGLWLAWPASIWAQGITATIALGGSPHAVAINRATNKVYVAGLGPRGSRNGIVTVIDGLNHSTTTVQVGVWPLAVGVNEATNKIYVANQGELPLGIPGSISVIDGATNSTTTVVDPNGRNPRSLAVNASTNKIYVANFLSGNVTVIDGATNSTTTVTDPNANGLAAVAVAINPVTNTIYVANNNGDRAGNNPGNVTVIDGTTHSTTTVTDLNAIGPNAVAVNTMTNRIYVTNGGAYPAANHGNVTVIDGATNSTATVTDANALAPQALAVNAKTNKIYVANANDATVSWKGVVTVIDGATNSVTTVTDPDAQDPGAVAVNEATDMVYVANGGCVPGPGNGCSNPGANPGSITVIRGATNSVATIIDPKANSPEAVAVDPATDHVYVANIGTGNLTVIDGGGIAATHTLGVLLAGTGGGTVTSSPLGIDCGTTCEENVAAGSVVSLSTVASSGAAFAGWSGPCSGTGSCDVVANTDEFVTATFNSTVAVPNVVGQTQTAATTAITGAGLVVGTVTQQASSTVASGEVLGESPAGGTNVAGGSTVNMVVSSGSSTGGGGGGGVDSLTLGALLSVLMATRCRVTHRTGRSGIRRAWSLSRATPETGSRPEGMVLGQDGSLSGTPTTAGTYTISLSVVESADPTAVADYALSLTVN
jgi:DNA-binding beta-propeller fold protein YncE